MSWGERVKWLRRVGGVKMSGWRKRKEKKGQRTIEVMNVTRSYL